MIVCNDKSKFDVRGAVKNRRAAQEKLLHASGASGFYKNVQPRVMAEAFIGGADGSLPDYKFFLL
ncbi:MAG: hypothetical protein R2881_10605 [Eubacteriales bacterium]